MKEQDLTEGVKNEEASPNSVESRLVAWAKQSPQKMPLDVELRVKERLARLPRQNPNNRSSLLHTLTLFLLTFLLMGLLWRFVSKASYGNTSTPIPSPSVVDSCR